MSARRATPFAVVVSLLLLAPAASAFAADVSAGVCPETAAQSPVQQIARPLRQVHQIVDAKSPSALIEDVLAPYLSVGATHKVDRATVDHVLELASHDRTSLRMRITLLWAANVLPSHAEPGADTDRLTTAAMEGFDFQSLSKADKLEFAKENLTLGRGSVIGVSRTEKSIQAGDVSKMKLPHPLGLLVTDRIEQIRASGMKKGDLTKAARPTSITVERWSRGDESWAYRLSLSFDAKRGSNSAGNDGWLVTQLLDGRGRPLQTPQWSESGNDGD